MSGFDVGVHAPNAPINGLDAAKTGVLVAYVASLAHDLLLDHWTIKLLPEKHGQDVIAQTFVASQGRFAEVSLHPSLFDEEHDEGDVRQTIIHELLHLHVENLFDDMLGMLESALPAAAFEPLKRRQIWQMERAVDGLADAIAKHYPLIEWPVESDDGATDAGRA